MNEQPHAPQDGAEAAVPDAPSVVEAAAPRLPDPPTVVSPPPPADGPAGSPLSSVSDRPEVAVGAAFVGGFVLALILRRLAR